MGSVTASCFHKIEKTKILPEHKDLPRISVAEAITMWNSFMESSGIRDFCAKCGGSCCKSHYKTKKLVCGRDAVDYKKCHNSIACTMYLCSFFNKYIPKELQYVIARFADTMLYGKVFPKQTIVTNYSSILQKLEEVDWVKALNEENTK